MPARDCVGAARCPYGAECFAEASRARAREADIVVTNHSLLAVDMLAERHIVPPHKLLIVDEAHELADRVSSAAQAELTPDAIERAARRARPLLAPGRRRGAGRGRPTRSPSAWPTPRPAGSPPACRRRCAQACTLLDSATRAGLDAIGDIKADDPDPVRKQQAKATLDELSDHRPAAARGVRPRRGLGGEVRPGQRPPRAGGRPAVGRRHPRHTASTTSARSSPPRRRWRWAAGSTRWPGRSACRRRPGARRSAAPAGLTAGRAADLRRRLELARRRLPVRLPQAGHPVRRRAPAPARRVRPARRRRRGAARAGERARRPYARALLLPAGRRPRPPSCCGPAPTCRCCCRARSRCRCWSASSGRTGRAACSA